MKKIILIILLIIPINIKALETSATSAILMDTDSKRILYSKNIHDVRSVASISKIMTSIVALENIDIEKEITVGDEIESAYGSGIYIKQGEHIKIKDLLYGLMLRSGNDAAHAIAKNVGGTIENFVKMMNDKAKEIGMKNTEFNNPSGLDEQKGNYSTSYDMGLLISYAIKNSTFKQIVSTKKHTVETDMNVYSWTNKNKLLFNYKYATGGKTGYTEIARRTLVETATKDNLKLAAVTLNDGNDFKDHEDMFEYGFNNYKNYKIIESGNIGIIDDYYLAKETYINDSFTYPLTESEKDNIVLKIMIENKIVEGKIGKIEVYLAEEKIHEQDLYVRKKEKRKSIIEKIKEWFKNDK